MRFIEGYLKRLVDDRLVPSDGISGCSDNEIEKIEEAQQASLPELYGDFLRSAGKAAGNLMVGSDWRFPEPLTLKNYAKELVVENGSSPDFLEGAIVFLMHQGYMFYYFAAESLSEPDPPVWLYVEVKQDPPRPTGGRFSRFLESQERQLRETRIIEGRARTRETARAEGRKPE